MKGKTLGEWEHYELLKLLRDMEKHLNWILQVNPKMERWETLVDSWDIEKLSTDIKRIAEISGLEGDLA